MTFADELLDLARRIAQLDGATLSRPAREERFQQPTMLMLYSTLSLTKPLRTGVNPNSVLCLAAFSNTAR
jgi:hypothetical protein